MYIELTRGYITLVDDDLLDELNSYLWYASGVDGRPARRLKTEGRKLIFMYHQILRVNPWELRQKGLVVDHINNDPLDNRKQNLRITTLEGNARNTARHIYRKGISFDTRHKRWKVYIDRPDMLRVNIGTYIDGEDAERALAKARREYGLENY